MRPTEPRVTLERPTLRRERDYLDACHRSRILHRGLVAAATTPADYRDYLERAARPTQESFFVVAITSGQLAGVVNVLDVARDAMPIGRLAYFAFLPHAGSGLMCEGVKHVIDVSFSELALARLDADIEPGNARSRALVERLGFRRGRFSPLQLKIGARWRAHERWTLLRSESLAVDGQELAARA
ncbi:MAG: GNAT family N-acetyltransferase [Gammaproteobacteria bacterium]